MTLRSPLLSAERLRTLSLVLIPVAAVLVAGALTPVPQLFLNNGDIRVYVNDGSALLSGRIPYLQFRSEYPPLAFVMFVGPLLVTGLHPTMQDFAWLYLIESALVVAGLGLAIAWIGARWSGPSEPADGAVTTWALLGAVLAPLMAWRFDVLPALLSVIALALLLERRPFASGIALGLSVAAKLYALPLFAVLAVVALRDGGRRGAARLLAGGAIVIAIAMLPILLLGGPKAFSFISYQSNRGLQLESVPAGIVELASALVGQRPTVGVAFGSWELFSPWSAPILHILPLVMYIAVGAVTAAAAVYLYSWRRGSRLPVETIAGACVAVLVAAIVTDKVLSPQYLVWLVPFVPFARPVTRWIAAGAAALTVAIYPVFYLLLRQQHMSAIVALNIRNGLLVVILALALATYLAILPTGVDVLRGVAARVPRRSAA